MHPWKSIQDQDSQKFLIISPLSMSSPHVATALQKQVSLGILDIVRFWVWFWTWLIFQVGHECHWCPHLFPPCSGLISKSLHINAEIRLLLPCVWDAWQVWHAVEREVRNWTWGLVWERTQLIVLHFKIVPWSGLETFWWKLDWYTLDYRNWFNREIHQRC